LFDSTFKKCGAAAEQGVPDSAQTTSFESQSTAGNLHIGCYSSWSLRLTGM